jgi:hypothetical protein
MTIISLRASKRTQTLTDQFDRELSPEETDNIIESIAQDVVRRRLETPAILFLESHKPLAFVASQALIVGTPVLGSLFGLDKIRHYSGLLQSRDNIEKLLQRIEALTAERDQQHKKKPKE